MYIEMNKYYNKDNDCPWSLVKYYCTSTLMICQSSLCGDQPFIVSVLTILETLETIRAI